jgi:hypothetical protein
MTDAQKARRGDLLFRRLQVGQRFTSGAHVIHLNLPFAHSFQTFFSQRAASRAA